MVVMIILLNSDRIRANDLTNDTDKCCAQTIPAKHTMIQSRENTPQGG